MGQIGPQGKRRARDTEHRECSDGMGWRGRTQQRAERVDYARYPDADETNQGSSEQSQKSETQMEGVGYNATG